MTHEEALLKAEEFQKEAAKKCQNTYWRPQYHIAAPAGWINDPNGFCYFNGEYHLFYQYHPYSSEWGPMHWGHVSSDDLAVWKNQPIALAPTDTYDKDGCFSGSALEKDGKMYALYTGHVDLDKSLGGDDRIESQCLAVSDDGITFKKVAENPVIKRVPENMNIRTEHFRDPKMWKHGDVYYTVVGAQTKEETGQVLVYKSTDLYNWDFVNIMAKSKENENVGFMWECPNFAEFDGQEALIFSPQGVEPEGNKFLNKHQSGYFLGKMNYETGEFERETPFDILDYGFDFYAPQVMQDEINDRCLMIGWLDMWESKMPEQKDGWSCQMSIPRVLKMKDGVLCCVPAVELEKLRKSHVYEEATSNEVMSWEDVSGDCYELNAVMDLAKAEGITLKLRATDEAREIKEVEIEETVLTYDKATKLLKLNRDKSGSGMSGEREVEIDLEDEKLSLQIFSDRSSLEIFVNGGKRVMSVRIYPRETAKKIVFIPNGLVNVKVDFYKF